MGYLGIVSKKGAANSAVSGWLGANAGCKIDQVAVSNTLP